MNGHGIDDHPALRFLYLIDFDGLALDAHITMNEADTPLPCHADGSPGFGNRIHSGTDNGNIQR